MMCSALGASHPAPPGPDQRPVISKNQRHLPKSDKGIIDLPNCVFGEILADTDMSLFVFGMKVGTWR